MLKNFILSSENRVLSREPLGFILAGKETESSAIREIFSPYDDLSIAKTCHATAKDLRTTVETSAEGFEVMRKMPSWKKSGILLEVVALLEKHREILAMTIASEAGKPLKAARQEVDRAAFTFQVASEECRRIEGKIIKLDWLPGNENRHGQIFRMPRGPVLGISPFNFPLNLVAHKVAPAIAAGNSIIIRPASQTSVTALLLGVLLVEAGMPPKAVSVVPCSTADASALIADERIKVLSFTGSPEIGWMLKEKAGRKMVTLELGGNAGNIVHEDADLEWATNRIAWGGFTYSGQTCISVQRVYIHEKVYAKTAEMLVEKANALKIGHPLDESTDIGPVIDKESAQRIRTWIEAARKDGARLLAGGDGSGNVVPPTIVESENEALDISCREVFGPVIVLSKYKDISDAIRRVNESRYGLQAGLFTKRLDVINEAVDKIEVGGLNVNDVSTFRIDHMPYGGVKHSGFGREGVSWAMEEMMELKLVTYNDR